MNQFKKVPVWFYIVAVLAVVWNAMGIFAYLSTVMMSTEDFAKMPQAMQDLQKATPLWAIAAFAIAVFAGTIGCLLLLIKKALAFPVLVLSLIAVMVQMSNFIFLMEGFDVISQEEMIMTLMVIIVAFLLMFFAKVSKAKGWIR